ncbi:putative Iron-sulfur cluster biosynthesis protein Isd11 [Taphrina deformans PYCC 5710]|uniref:Iron-sulfur cluster biosynthesis protein Isd11 n=1 Tax=Taphrina deformans (strain PYCC 5710 / ATCC 11124 / CBS 356.35 / IMI 108563 / JCM 9778 / NBRC 8474) TaxID=1097556 RepID=R4XA92_TAPDE|nr:putative Iron-sulfur cluster biosynthesis protein Isd11 [Taphrina deformans PYCC 5710]|eukprot:CCG82432.1 putative Iron-sulfur cluster biosynthesis protein Isd11 [Taphrina deformans PYCC 5710]
MSQSLQALSLYRSIIRAAQPLPYNFRQYAKRRARDSFTEFRSLQDGRQVQEVFQAGLEDLRMLKRQGTIHGMFHTDPLVVEGKLAGKQTGKDNELVRTREIGYD